MLCCLWWISWLSQIWQTAVRCIDPVASWSSTTDPQSLAHMVWRRSEAPTIHSWAIATSRFSLLSLSSVSPCLSDGVHDIMCGYVIWVIACIKYDVCGVLVWGSFDSLWLKGFYNDLAKILYCNAAWSLLHHHWVELSEWRLGSEMVPYVQS